MRDYYPVSRLFVAALTVLVVSGCTTTAPSVDTPSIKIDESTTWQQKVKLALAEAKSETRYSNDNAERLLFAALNQLPNDGGLAKDPEFENLMLYDFPDVMRDAGYNGKRAELVEKILMKRLEIVQREYGKESIQADDALFDLFSFEGSHDQKKQQAYLQELRQLNEVLEKKGTPRDTSEWQAKKDKHQEEVTGEKIEQPSYSVATQDIAAGEVITKEKVKKLSAPYSRQPKGAFDGGGLLYGCRTVKAVKKDAPIRTEDLCDHPGALMWETVLETDAPWVKAAKSAMQAVQKKDYSAGMKYYDQLADELTKLAEAKKSLNDYCENCYLSPILSYDTCATNGNTTKADENKSIAWHKKVLAALKRLMPEDNDDYKYESDILKSHTDPKASEP